MSEHDSSDFSDDDFEEDNESTLNEEEALNENGDIDEELRLLNEENEISVEELRRRYYGDAVPAEPTLPSDLGNQPGSSTSTAVTPQTLKTLFVDNSLSDSEDEEYIPLVPEYWKKEIRIGDDYQVAGLPDLKTDISIYTPTVESTALWRPKRTEGETELLHEFINRVNKIMHDREREVNGLEELPPQANRIPKSTAFADNEDALYVFFKCNYDSDEAVKKIPFPTANALKITGPKEWKSMSADDIEAFETGFRDHGKNFYLIQKHELPNRSVGELVDFYYHWKKTERHDMFVETNRALGIFDTNTKTLDPMDSLADQQLGEVNGITHAATSALLSSAQHPPHLQHKTWLSVQHNAPPSQGSSSSQPKQP